MFGASQSLLKYNVTRFDSSASQHVSVGDVPELAFEYTDSFSLAIWFRNTSLVHQKLSSKETFSPNRGYSLVLGGSLATPGSFGIIIGGVASRIWVYTDDSYADGLWHLGVATYDGSQDESGVALYVDGEAVPRSVAQNNVGAASLLTSVGYSIGSREDGLDIFLDSDVQDHAVFDGAVSAAEVESMFDRGAPPDLLDIAFGVNMVGYWLLGEHKGDVGGAAGGVTSGTTVPDLSASGNDGTMVNGPLVVTRL